MEYDLNVVALTDCLRLHTGNADKIVNTFVESAVRKVEARAGTKM